MTTVDEKALPSITSPMKLLQNQVRSLENALEAEWDRVERYKKRDRYMQQQVDIFRTRVEEVEILLKNTQQEHNTALRTIDDMTAQLSQLNTRAKQSGARIEELEHAMSHARKESRNASILLDTTTAELRQAQTYLSRIDDVADSKVMRIVESLNARIFQTAATIADAFRHQYGPKPRLLVVDDASEILVNSGLFDRRVIRALRTMDHSNDSLLVQTAIQAVMVTFTEQLCGAWGFNSGGSSVLLKQVYADMRRSEVQSVSGRWRALWRTYANACLPRNEERLKSESVEAFLHMVGLVTRVLLICRVPGTPETVINHVGNTYFAAIYEIVQFGLWFQRITGEHVISRDLLAVAASPGDIFDPDRMADEWAEPKKGRQSVQTHPVLCATQLGLVREEAKACGEEGDGVEISHTILLKPTVVLTSLLEQLQNEQV